MFWDVYGEKCFGMFRRRIECLAGEKTGQEYNGANQHCGSTNQPFPTQPFLLDCNTKSINFQRENKVSLSIKWEVAFPKKTSGAWEATRSARCRTSPGVPCSSSSTSGSTWSSSCLSSLLPTSASSPISCWTGKFDYLLQFWIKSVGEDKPQLKCWKDANFDKIPKSIGYMLLMRQNANYKLYLNLRRCQFWWNAKV